MSARLNPRFAVAGISPIFFQICLVTCSLNVYGIELEPIWTNVISANSLRVTGVAGDAFGNVFLSGRVNSALPGAEVTGLDALIIKYDGNGNQLWARQYGSAIAETISVDLLGNVIVVGETSGIAGPTLGQNDAYVRKYDPNGMIQWTRQFGTSVGDASFGAGSDSTGNVFVAGYQGYTGANGTGDAFLRKYDAAGNLIWDRLLSTPLGDRAQTLSTDSLGNVFIAGFTEGHLADTDLGGQDAFVSKYNNSGDLLWTKQFGTGAVDLVQELATDSAGNVYASGQRGSRGLLRKYSPTGSLVWQRFYADVDYFAGISLDGFGNLYVGGLGGTEGFLSHYREDGTLISQVFPDTFDLGAYPYFYADGRRGLYAAGKFFEGGQQKMYLRKFQVVPEPTGVAMIAIVGAIAAYRTTHRSRRVPLE